MVAGGRLKRTKRFTIKSLRGKKEKREKEEMEGKRGKKGCRRILFVAIVSRGEKRLIYGRVRKFARKSLPVLSSARGKHSLSESRPNKIRSRERMCRKKTNLRKINNIDTVHSCTRYSSREKRKSGKFSTVDIIGGETAVRRENAGCVSTKY